MSGRAIAKRSGETRVAQPARRAESARKKAQSPEEEKKEKDQILANRWLAFVGMMMTERARREIPEANETVIEERKKHAEKRKRVSPEVPPSDTEDSILQAGDVPKKKKKKKNLARDAPKKKSRLARQAPTKKKKKLKTKAVPKKEFGMLG